MVNYNNGKIYALKSYQTENIYIGSTCEKIYTRFSKHKYDFRNRQDKCKAREILKYNDCYILLLDKYSCNDKTQLLEKEREYILKHKDICINKQIPLRTKKQYYIDNREKIRKYKKEHRDPEKENARARKWYEANKNNEQFKIKKKERSKKWYDKNNDYNKNYYENKKNKISEQRKIKIKCICGSEYRKCDKSRHNKTKKHLKYINND